MKPILYKASKVKNYKIKIISKTLTKFNIELSAQYTVYTNRGKCIAVGLYQIPITNLLKPYLWPDFWFHTPFFLLV